MRLVRFQTIEGKFWGEFQPEGITPIIGDPFQSFRLDSQQYQHQDVKLLAPVVPSKIICVGLNYRDHIAESSTADTPPSEPLLFFKPPSSLIGPGETIVLPTSSEQVDFEGELALIIGQRCYKVAEAEADEFIFGLSCANDVTARDYQRKDKQWARAKGFDTFCPIGPWVDVGLDYHGLEIETLVNMIPRQQANVNDMVFNPAFLVSFISSIMTLEVGDVILTGTPAGVGALSEGQRIEVRIQNLGSLVNDVRLEL
ncbi:fumarylacetoacetate hydrolase family protein [Gemmatimonas aurantiaca]|nr:fumarylacetoacetate hydrolase family protein [Gemmatimonas aurantiaca]